MFWLGPTLACATDQKLKEVSGQILAESQALPLQLSGFYAYVDTGATPPAKYRVRTNEGTATRKVYRYDSNHQRYLSDSSYIRFTNQSLAGPGTITFSATTFAPASFNNYIYTYGSLVGRIVDRGFFGLYDVVYDVMRKMPSEVTIGVTTIALNATGLKSEHPQDIALENGGAEVYWDWNVSETLSVPFTPDLAMTRAKLLGTKGSDTVAFSAEKYEYTWAFPVMKKISEDFSRVCYPVQFPGQSVKFRVEFRDVKLPPGDYVVKYKFKKWHKGQPEPGSANYFPLPDETITLGKNDVCLRTADKEIPQPAMGDNVRIVSATTMLPACACTADTCSEASTDSVNYKISLGTRADGKMAGFLTLRSDTITPAIYSTASWGTYIPAADEVVPVRDQDQMLLQVKTSQRLADLVQLDASTNEVRFYPIAQVGSLDAGTGRYTVTGDPYVVYKVEDPDAGTGTRVKVTETRGMHQKIALYSTEQIGGQPVVVLTDGDGVRRERVERAVVDGQQRIERRIVTDGHDVTKSSIVTQFKQAACGEVVVAQRVELADGKSLDTLTTYYENKSTDGGAFGWPKEVLRPDGTWERYKYNNDGRVTKTYQPFGDKAPTWTDDQCRVIENVYADLPDMDGDALPEKLTTTNERVLGTEVRRSYHLEYSKTVNFGGSDCWKMVDSVCTVAGAAQDAVGNLVTTSYEWASGDHQNELRAAFGPDGTATLNNYVTSPDGTEVLTSRVGVPNLDGTDIVNGVETKSVQTKAQKQVLEQTTSDIASGLEIQHWIATSVDEQGRPTRLDYLDGTYLERIYGCCDLESETDRQGMTTVYGYDSLGRRESTTRAGITTTSIHDAAGRVVTVARQGSDGSTIIQSTTEYDWAGRVTGSKDALLRPTTFTETVDASGHRVVTATTPSGTRIETFGRDGAMISLKGTTVAPIQYEYGVDADGLFTKVIRLGSRGETTEWTKAYTDFAGRAYKNVFPVGATSIQFFNAKGQLWKAVDPDGVATLFAYNDLAEQTVIASDLNRNDSIDFSGSDRIRRTTRSFLSAHGTTVQRLTTEVWDVDNSDTPRTASTLDTSTDGSGSWQTVDSLTTQFAIAINAIAGTRTETTHSPDGVLSIRQYAQGRLTTASVRASDSSALTSSEYAFDPHGRLQSVTDARNGATIYTYYDDDQVHTVTTPDPDQTKSGPGYDPQVTAYEYDASGRLWRTTLPDAGVVTNEYFGTGSLKKTFGSRTYPQEYTYDSQGRVSTLTTWQDFSGNRGKALILWNYDPARGWLITKHDSTNQGPVYTYYPSGRLKTRTWARLSAGSPLTTTYGWSNSGDLSEITYSDNTPAVAQTFDRLGRPLETTDRAGTLTRSYHANGQLQNETYGASGLLQNLAVNRTFDVMDRPSGYSVSSTASIPSVSYSYNPQTGRLQTITSGVVSTIYGYLPNSTLVQTITVANADATRLTVTKAYDKLNRLTGIASVASTSNSNLGSSSSSYLYNSANQRTRLTREDGTHWDYGYDTLGQVTSAAKALDDATPVLGQDFAYSFDTIGNRTSATVNGRKADYNATLLNQYARRTVPGAVDVFGTAASDATVTANLQRTERQGDGFHIALAFPNDTAPQFPSIKIVGVKNGARPDGKDSIDEVTRQTYLPKNPEIYSHDADGNLTADGRWTYTWDAENRLVSMETAAACLQAIPGFPAQRLEFAYDAQGRRIQKKVSNWNGSVYLLATDTRFLYDGWNLIAEFSVQQSAFSLLRSYIWGLDLSGSLQGAGGVGGLLAVNSGTSTFLPTFDGNGNVLGLVNASTGTFDAQYEYGPFGEPLKATGLAATANPFQFSTKYTDSGSDLLYYGLRYYNPSTGRWLSRDPIAERGGVNLYGMVGNDPIYRTDFLGLAKISVDNEIWETPIVGDLSHPHTLPDGRTYTGPHMHGPDGKKYFPELNLIFNTRTKCWEDAGNSFRKKFLRAVENTLKSPKIRNRILGLMAVAFIVADVSSTESSAQELRSLYLEYQNAYINNSDHTAAAVGVAAWVQNNGGGDLGAAIILANLLPAGRDSEEPARNGNPTQPRQIVAESPTRRIYNDGTKEDLVDGVWVPVATRTGAYREGGD